MAQRFNAPPGWNVPPNFVPTSDWQPDPSWPPAPEGWNYWVEDTAAPAAPAAYGTPPSPAVPTPDAPSVPYGTPPSPAYGAPAPGAFGSTAPGSAQGVIAQGQAAGAKRNALIGGGLIVLVIVLVFLTDRLFWYLGIVGIVLLIKGLIDMNKAKKAAAAAYGASMPGGITPPGQNPPGTF